MGSRGLLLPIAKTPGDVGSLQGRSATDYLDYLVGNCRLSHPIHVQRQAVNQLLGILGSRIHGRHPRPLFRRN